MSFLGLFRPRKASAPVARERLQVLLAHERTQCGRTDLLAVLHEEILAAISRHVKLDAEHVKVSTRRGKTLSTLKVDIEIPTAIQGARTSQGARTARA
jgi:cell division topological specificity factor